MVLERAIRGAIAVGFVFVSLGTADEASPVTMDESEIGGLLTEGFRLYVWPNHVYDGATVRIRLDCSFPDELREWISRVGESDVKANAALSQGFYHGVPCYLKLALMRPHESAWTADTLPARLQSSQSQGTNRPSTKASAVRA